MITPAQNFASTLPPSLSLRTGVVESTSPLYVTVSGQPVLAGILGSYTPAAGDYVAVLRFESTWLVLGDVSTTTDIPDA